LGIFVFSLFMDSVNSTGWATGDLPSYVYSVSVLLGH